jgi:tRNA pseudouridine32 synthase / 23S rRNA pseudouridine746 synthase
MTALDPAKWIIWLDDHLLVVDKPAGLPTLVEGWKPDAPYLVGILKQTYNPLWVAHRLDKETSGVIVFALTAEAHRSLNQQFDRRQIEKTYLALVWGNPDWGDRQIHLPLRPNADRRHRTLVDPRNGKPSSTDFVVLERFTGFSLLRAIPHTGRTHQIRAHLSAIGFPIVGDRLYGGAQIEGLNRLGLHADSLTLRHPASGGEMNFKAQVPEDLSRILKRLSGN